MGMADIDAVKELRAQLTKERADNRSLLRELRVRDDRVIELEAVARERDLAGRAALKPVVVEREQHAAGAAGYPCTIWSDWHWGETVDVRQMGGLNAFNPEIARARIAKLTNGTLTLLSDYAGSNQAYPGMWLALGGDMISGGIHEELRDTDWTPTADQVVEVTEALAGAIGFMADRVPRRRPRKTDAEPFTIHVPCVVGNHGRTSQRPRAKTIVRESREWIVYKHLEQHFAGDKRVRFYIPETSNFLFNVYGHRFNLTHGDRLGVKGGDGIIGALGPIARGSMKQHRRQSQVGREYDTLVIGHWHMYTPRGDGIGTIVNGTMKGYDEFAQDVLGVPFSEPAQALWLVSPKHGIAAQWRVDCGNLTGVDR